MHDLLSCPLSTLEIIDAILFFWFADPLIDLGKLNYLLPPHAISFHNFWNAHMSSWSSLLSFLRFRSVTERASRLAEFYPVARLRPTSAFAYNHCVLVFFTHILRPNSCFDLRILSSVGVAYFYSAPHGPAFEKLGKSPYLTCLDVLIPRIRRVVRKSFWAGGG